MKAPSGQNRRHKPHPEIAGLSRKERAAESAAAPLVTLGAVLGRDERFMKAVESLRADPGSLDSLARRYAPKAGRGRRALAHMLKAAAAEGDQTFAQARLTNLTPAVWADDPLDNGDRVRWLRSGAGHRNAAERIARRGAGLCLALECPTVVTGRRLWCSAHERTGLPSEREADERSMRTLLDAAARALGF